MIHPVDYLLSRLERWEVGGLSRDGNGVIVYRRAGYTRSYSLLHSIFPPIPPENLDLFKGELSLRHSSHYLRHLENFNGANLFAGHLALYGVRHYGKGPLAMSGLFELWTANLAPGARLKQAGAFVVGSWNSPELGQQLSIAEFPDGRVELCGPRPDHVRATWTDFDTFLPAMIDLAEAEYEASEQRPQPGRL